MDVCDKVNDDPENGAKRAIDIIQNKLQTNVANRQIYSLVLVDALAQNCGSKMHREIASRSFTSGLLEMVSESTIHAAVKSKVMEVMKTLSREFRGDPSLRQMEDAFNTVKQQNPAFAPPEVPQKHQLTAQERQKEEDDLELALKLSLQDAEPSSSGFNTSSYNNNNTNSSSSGYQTTPQSSQPQPQQQQQQQPNVQETARGKTAATVNRVRALYDLTSEDPGELSFRRGDVIAVIESVYRDWWKGSLKGQIGIFPLNYVTPVADPTPDELEQEARDEAEVFAEAKNVEKLLALLSSSENGGSIAENDELQRLYHSTQGIRPKLVKLIEKYSQKRDDLIDLDKRFISARRTYDHLIDSSLSHISMNAPPGPGQSPYGQAQPKPQGFGGYNPSQPTFSGDSPGQSNSYQPAQSQPTGSGWGQQQQPPANQQAWGQPSQSSIPSQPTGPNYMSPLQPEHVQHAPAPSYGQSQYTLPSQTTGQYQQQPPSQPQHQQQQLVPPAGTLPNDQGLSQAHNAGSNQNSSYIIPAGSELNDNHQQSYNYGNNQY